MSLQRPLVPKFLKRWEDNLLLHKPEIWSARTHLVIYYGILFMAALALIAYIAPDDPRADSLSSIWVGFVSIVSILALVIWLIYLLRFNVFKRYGIIKPMDRLITFLLYFIAVCTIVLFTYVQPWVESKRANQAYGNEEIVQDINAFNTKICQLEYDSLHKAWGTDTVRVTAHPLLLRNDGDEAVVAVDSSDNNATGRKKSYYTLIDISRFQRRLANGDSVNKLRDSVYVFYDCPKYTFLNIFNSDRYSREKELGDEGVYKKVIKDYTPPDKIKVRKELSALIAKYDIDTSYSADYYDRDSKDYMQQIRFRYKIYDVDRGINNIVRRKYRWAPVELSWFFRFLYYTTLVVTLLIFIFRHSTTKTFFLSLLTAVILVILTALFMAFTKGYNESSIYAWLIGYFLFFFFITLLLWKSSVRSAVIGIAINLFVFLVPIIPLVIVACHYAILREHRVNYNIEPYNSSVMDRNLLYGEIAGAILLIVLIVTYIQALYRRWYALPKE